MERRKESCGVSFCGLIKQLRSLSITTSSNCIYVCIPIM
ncbi:unnamed protein product [Brassica rapa subsp. trilocularis]